VTQDQYEIITEICRNICKDPNLVHDLIQEVALIYLELSNKKKQKVDGYFRFWVSRVVTNQWHSNTSPFYTQYRSSLNVDPNEIYDLSEDPKEPDESPEPEDLIEDLIDQLFISDKNIFQDYYQKGLTIHQITDKYNIEKTYTWHTIDRIRRSLKRRTNWILNRDPEMKVKMSEIIMEFLGRSRLKVDERQYILDCYNHLTGSGRNKIHDREEVTNLLIRLVGILKL